MDLGKTFRNFTEGISTWISLLQMSGFVCLCAVVGDVFVQDHTCEPTTLNYHGILSLHLANPKCAKNVLLSMHSANPMADGPINFKMF